mmetsp:Transcript_21657/g.51533  ORF Transcript_21657/g.51533 Transcript_21657/m.51533 type:complete len:293 (-) Transcript_21657:235-1113(-)
MSGGDGGKGGGAMSLAGNTAGSTPLVVDTSGGDVAMSGGDVATSGRKVASSTASGGLHDVSNTLETSIVASTLPFTSPSGSSSTTCPGMATEGASALPLSSSSWGRGAARASFTTEARGLEEFSKAGRDTKRCSWCSAFSSAVVCCCSATELRLAFERALSRLASAMRAASCSARYLPTAVLKSVRKTENTSNKSHGEVSSASFASFGSYSAFSRSDFSEQGPEWQKRFLSSLYSWKARVKWPTSASVRPLKCCRASRSRRTYKRDALVSSPSRDSHKEATIASCCLIHTST